MFIQVKSFSNVCRFYQPNSKFVSKTNSDIKTQKCTSVTFILIKYRVVPSTVLEPSAWKRLGIKTRHILLYALFHSILQSCHDRKLKTIGSKNIQLLKGKKNHNLIHQIIFYHFYFFLYFRLLFYSQPENFKVTDEMMFTSRPQVQPHMYKLHSSFMNLLPTPKWGKLIFFCSCPIQFLKKILKKKKNWIFYF